MGHFCIELLDQTDAVVAATAADFPDEAAAVREATWRLQPGQAAEVRASSGQVRRVRVSEPH